MCVCVGGGGRCSIAMNGVTGVDVNPKSTF